jgi:hypothetical protein
MTTARRIYIVTKETQSTLNTSKNIFILSLLYRDCMGLARMDIMADPMNTFLEFMSDPWYEYVPITPTI